MTCTNSPINPSIVLRKRKSSRFMDQLARRLLMHGDVNYQQAFHRVIVAAAFRLRHFHADRSVRLNSCRRLAATDHFEYS
jgi:hypothetical protein